MEYPITTTPIPLQCNGKAHAILKNMREKRESFIASNSFLLNSQLGKKPTHKRKRRGTESALRVKDILSDMENARNSLSTVIKNHTTCKCSTRSAGKRSTRSEGQSTAITAAETESLISSCADDDSFCYSDTTREEIPGFQFIIDTEESESDFCSLSTREEVERAVGTIYEKIIPHALSAINLDENKIQSPKNYYSWKFTPENTAGELYRNGGIRSGVAEKKRRRIKNSQKKREMARVKLEMSESDEQNNKMKSLLDSVSKIKNNDDGSRSCSLQSSDQSQRTNRRRRKEKSFQNSRVDPYADMQQIQVEEQKMRERVTEKRKRRIRAAEKKKEMAKMKKETVSSSFISGGSSSIEIVRSLEHQKSTRRENPVTSKIRQNVPSSKAPATPTSVKSSTRRPSRLRQYDTSDGSNPILVNSTHSKDEKKLGNDSAVTVSEHQKVEDKRPALKPIHQNLSRSSINKRDLSVGNLLVPNRSEDESDVLIFEEPDDTAQNFPVSIPISFLKSTTPPEKSSGFAEKSKKPLASKSDIEYMPRNMISREKKSYLSSAKRPAQRNNGENPMYTIEDIMEEMNRLATKNASEGLKIPNGTILKLRRLEDTRKTINDEQSCTGWSFAEASEISTLGPIFNEESLVKPSFEKSSTNQTRNSRAYIDITNRFCGGHYHMALMSGMPAGTPDLEV